MHHKEKVPDLKRNGSSKARDHAYDSARAIFLFWIFLWHVGRCGPRPSCFPQPELRALWGYDSFLIYITRYLMGTLPILGLCYLSGAVLQRRRIKWNAIIMKISFALVLEYILAPAFDSGIEFRYKSRNTAGHAWFLWTNAIAMILIKFTHDYKLPQSALTAFSLFLYYAVPHILPRPKDITEDWYNVFSLRIFTHVIFIIIGYQLPQRWIEQIPSTAAWTGLLTSIMFSAKVLLGNGVYSRLPIEMFWPVIIDSTAFLLTGILFTVTSLRLCPKQDSFVASAGRNTVFPYIAHPFLLKLVRGTAEGFLIQMSIQIPALKTFFALFYAFIFPLFLQTILTVPFMLNLKSISALSVLRLWTHLSITYLFYKFLTTTSIQLLTAYTSTLSSFLVLFSSSLHFASHSKQTKPFRRFVPLKAIPLLLAVAIALSRLPFQHPVHSSLSVVI